MTQPSVSLVIPCKNEGESIYTVLKEIQDVFTVQKIQSYEIIVVNNNSEDNTVEEARRAAEKVVIVDCVAPGYGAAILKGIEHATFDVICMMDGDGSYNPKDISDLLKLYIFKKIPSLCIGNRFSHKKTENIKLLHRIFGVPMLNFVTNTLFKSPTHIDSHCGLRVFHKDIIHTLKITHTSFSFANEMICKALKYKIDIQQIPIILRKDLRTNSSSKIRVFKDGFDALFTILKIKFSK